MTDVLENLNASHDESPPNLLNQEETSWEEEHQDAWHVHLKEVEKVTTNMITELESVKPCDQLK